MDSVVGKQIIPVVFLFLLVIPTHACIPIIIPIPTPAHGGYAVVGKESIESLEPEKATRAEVLLTIGDPAERLQEDRFFVYRWELKHGYLFWAIVFPGGRGPSDVETLSGTHFLLIEFLPDNRLKRFQFIDLGLLSQRACGQLDELIQEWSRVPSDSK
jgi:hypothetical protein